MKGYLRDGVKLNATVYKPREQKQPLPCVFTLTPYISQSYTTNAACTSPPMATCS